MSGVDSIEAEWLRYFVTLGLENFDTITLDGAAFMGHIDRLADVVFSKGTKLDALWSSESSSSLELSSKKIESEDALLDYLKSSSDQPHTIVSIWQGNSLSPLSVSQMSMLRIFRRYRVSPEFLNVVCGFGDKRISWDEVSDTGVYNSFDGISYDISYQLRYVEKNDRSHGDPWSVRQTGVYHKLSGLKTINPRNMWMLLHPLQSSKLYSRLQETSLETLFGKGVDVDPLRLHLLIFSSYIDNWRMYLHDMTRQFSGLEDNLMTSELRDRSEHTKLNFETLQKLRHLAGKLIPIPAMLQASIKTVGSIVDMSNVIDLERKDLRENQTAKLTAKMPQTPYHLKAFRARLESYLAICHVLQSRIENMTKFLADGLNLQNQEISAESNGHLVTLTKDTVDDSATVRAITFVTLIYLPATFISGLLGSNLFAFQSETSNFVISHQFWIYFAITIPLTILTVGYWKYRTWQQAKKRAADAAILQSHFV